MIPRVRLGRSELETSRLTFGLSRLHHLASAPARQRLLAQAVDLGFRQFDTARMYGDGLAEAELGRFLKGRCGDRVLIATKFGIPADPVIEAAPPALGMPLRAVRALARRVRMWPAPARRWDRGALKASVAKSLKALDVERIDILFLHEPTLRGLAGTDELIEEVARLKTGGAIGAIGLSGGWRACRAVAARYPALAEVLQVPESEWTADDGPIPDLTFGAMSRGMQSLGTPRPDPATAVDRLRAALARRPEGAVVVSTTKPEHLKVLAAVAVGSSP